MKDVLYVPGLKNNILSISALVVKGMRVAFVDGQVLMWPRGKTIDDATMIEEEYYIHLYTRCKGNASCICRWPSANVA